MRTFALAVLFSFAVFAGACGSKESGILENAPEGVSDEEYLEVLCTGTEKFSSALVAQVTPEKLREVIREYAAALRAVVPPRDVSKFHQEYIAFVESAEAQPALLVNGSPPYPQEPARSRIAGKENTVEACKNPVFFAPEPTPTASP